ncbi:MAG: ice-binding family protein [Bacteroidales bacterium]|nr:ice-binding family protein [Bacteroidales bacterium]
MKKQLVSSLTVFLLLLIPIMNFAQAPPLGTAAGFVLFSSVGAVTNTGISHLTGNVGTNSGSSTGFGNVNGVMHDNDGASAQCSADLLIAYNILNSTIPNFFPAPLFGNGQTLIAGVYSISGAATLNGTLKLDALGNPNGVFIIQIQGSFSTAAGSKVQLINGAVACNVFWKVEGLVSMASGTTMRGTIIANNAAIVMNTGDTLEGRALSTAGAVTLDGVMAYTPVGCGSPVLTGPMAPALASTECYALFSSNGAVTNTGVTHVTGDVGTNVGLTVGFDPLLVTGTIHPIPDGSTAQCAADLLDVYNYLNILPYEIELLYPAQFGNNLVLTPHTYLLNAATTFTDTLYLNAMGYPNAVFVIKINGALSTNSYSKVVLINGAQAKNVFWKIEGAVSINSYSIFKGTIICNNGALGSLGTGVILDGRALTTTGALSTAAATVTMPTVCCTAGVIPNTLLVTGIVSGAETVCKNAIQTITVAGGRTTFQVQSGGSVTMIAGQNIRLLYGTKVSAGGYLHAYITTSGEYCCSTGASKSVEMSEVIPEMTAGTFFKVYPNATSDKFCLELDPTCKDTKVMVQIFGMVGNLILNKDLINDDRHEFSLGGKTPGIYFIRVMAGNRLETKKIVLK